MFKKIKSLFIVETEETVAEKSTPQKAEKSETDGGNRIVRAATVPTTPPTAPHIAQTTGELNDRFLQILFDALESNNLNGFDYLEFKKSLQSLSAMPLDEATRYKSAFAMAGSMNVTPQQLLDTAGHYLQVLAKEEEKFETALGQQKSTKVHAQEEQVKHLEAIVAQKAEQIKALTQEIETIQQQIETTRVEIADANEKAAKTQNDFAMSYGFVREQIQTDIRNMQQYLKGGTAAQ
jgi:hypothetical protein